MGTANPRRENPGVVVDEAVGGAVVVESSRPVSAAGTAGTGLGFGLGLGAGAGLGAGLGAGAGPGTGLGVDLGAGTGFELGTGFGASPGVGAQTLTLRARNYPAETTGKL